MRKHKIGFEWNRITPNIYLGTNMCCQMHFDKKLLKKGITADISLEKERMDAAYGVDYYLWLPVKDKTAPKQAQLRVGVEILEELIEMNKKVYIHCKNGHGRAPTLVAAYLIGEEGFSVKKAISFIKKKRTTIHLEPSQKKALERFGKSLNKK